MNNNMKPMTQDEFVAALFSAEKYYSKTIMQVKTVPAQPGFSGKVFITVEDLMTRDGTRTFVVTFATAGTTYVDTDAYL